MESLQKHFDIALDTPDGIKKLRELILTLAMQGKLVPQDPKDQPASELLKEIKAEKKKLVTEGKIRKQEALPPIKPEEVPYELPDGWEWCYLDDICFLINDGTHFTPNYVSNGVPFLSVKDLSSGILDFSNTKYIAIEEHKELSKRCNPEKNDVLLTKVGTTGIAVTVNTDMEFSLFVSVALLKLIKRFIFSEFITRLINSPLVRKYSAEGTEGVGNKNLVLRKIKSFVIPLPPLAEQKRIVVKIDELMALCDKLEAERNERDNKLLKVHTSAMNSLLTAPDKKTFDASWHFITEHFDKLYSVTANVAELKKAILQLAVMGKLVPQDPGDQPASELLKEIEAEKKKLVAEGKVKKQEVLPQIKQEEVPYELPKGWEWVRLENLTSVITKGSSPNWQGVNYTDSINGVLFITSENVDNYKLKLNNKKYVEKKFNEIEPRSILQKNDILMNIVGASIGRVAYYSFDEVANINQAVCLIRLLKQDMFVDLIYLLYFLNSNTCISYMFNKQVDNARANLSMGNISKFPIPIPPLAEQKRIVAKVDELMALCDKLDKEITSATEKKSAILNAVLVGI
jgi:type I restriction enzyme, S subunit